MREANANFPTQNRACVCITSALYDRRAIDAPAPSLPLINSLTHLSYLTATSPRIREILSVDGGLERLVRILKACIAGGSPPLDESLSELRGKGPELGKRARRSPFKPFSEYTPTIDLDVTLDDMGMDMDDDSTTATTSAAPPLYLAKPSQAPGSNVSLPSSRAKQLLFTYTLAFQCVVNIGVRGSETIRTRVVEAGALDVVVNVLEQYLQETARRQVLLEDGQRAKQKAIATSSSFVASTALTRPRLARLQVLSSDVPSASSSAASLAETSSAASVMAMPARVSTPDTVLSMDEGDTGSSSGHDDETVALTREQGSSRQRRMRSTSKGGPGATGADEDGDDRMQEDDLSTPQADATPSAHQPAGLAFPTPTPPPATHDATDPSVRNVDAPLQFRDEDVLLSLQLLAYLSKYPHVRSVFHSPATNPALAARHDHHACEALKYDKHVRPTVSSSSIDSKRPAPSQLANVFSLVEQFTHRPSTSDALAPRHSNEVQYWAGVIMRNACRKDESRGGIRQCANMECGVWEKYAREFAKCRRCRKAKYCSKTCQSAAWSKGHRYWCAKAAPKETAAGAVSTHAATGDLASVAGATAFGGGDAIVGVSTGATTADASAARRDRRLGTGSGRNSRSGAEDDDDDDDELSGPSAPPTAVDSYANGALSPAARARSLVGAPQPVGGQPRIGGLDTFGDVNGVGVGMALGMDENQVAQHMMDSAGVVLGGDGNEVVL